MTIQNQFFRFLASIFLVLFIYFLLMLVLNDDGDISEAFEAMFIFAVFGIFLFVPLFLFLVRKTNRLLTPKGQRKKKTKLDMILGWVVVLIFLLYLAAQFTDLLD